MFSTYHYHHSSLCLTIPRGLKYTNAIAKKLLSVMFNNPTNINKTRNHLSLNIKTSLTHDVGNQVLVWDRHTNVAVLNRLRCSIFPLYINCSDIQMCFFINEECVCFCMKRNEFIYFNNNFKCLQK